MPPRGELLDEPNAATDVSPVREAIPRETQVQVDVPAWTPMFATVSGPKFLALDQREQGIIKKLHINLGHPTSDQVGQTFVRNESFATSRGRRCRLCVPQVC